MKPWLIFYNTGKLEGLCGDCDGDQGNDMIGNGGFRAGDHDYATLGETWRTTREVDVSTIRYSTVATRWSQRADVFTSPPLDFTARYGTF